MKKVDEPLISLKDALVKPSARICIVCGKAHTTGRIYTCSERCHKKFIDAMVKKFGEHKKIVDATTNKAYKVPTRVILENGLKHSDLPKFPEWKQTEKGEK